MLKFKKIHNKGSLVRVSSILYVLAILLYTHWTEPFEPSRFWIVFGILILLLIRYSKLARLLGKPDQKDLYSLRYIDLFLILLILSLTSWKLPVIFLLYVSTILTAHYYGLKKAVVYAIHVSLLYGVFYWFFGMKGQVVQFIVNLIFFLISLLLTAYVGGMIDDKMKNIEETNDKLNQVNSEFFVLQQISNYVSSILNINDLLELIPDILIGISGAKYAAIYLTEDGTFRGLQIKATNFCEEEMVRDFFMGVCGSQIRNTFMTGELTIENSINCGEFGSMMNIPIKHKDEVLGVLVLTHYKPNSFSEYNPQLLKSVGEQLGISIANARLYAQVKQMANIDGLTRVYNRKYLQNYLNKHFAQSVPNLITLIMLDIDHFKHINDTYGHLMGDQVLKNLAHIIEKTIGEKGFLTRYGGEEFVILLPNLSTDEGYQIAEELRVLVMNQEFHHSNRSCKVTISLGVADNSLSVIETMDDLLKATDESLYAAKDKGRNCTHRNDKYFVS
ncbi:MAG: sensor domain-containing diguanylate cyclase [Halanaerobiales bacterium]|nr:sensor domain-containing diguanylate cyclase [Halanaerobiales bacterium]